jgi:protein-disulfide isomerase
MFSFVFLCLAGRLLSQEPSPRQRVHVSQLPGTFIRGPATAPVTIIEFSDYECPYCRRAAPLVEALLKEYEGRVRFIYRDLPLDIHDRAFVAAVAARCAGEQNKFWEYHRRLFSQPKDLSDEGLRESAEEVGVNLASFKSCLVSGRQDSFVEASRAEALKLDFKSTPTFVINGRVFPGVPRYAQFKAVVDEEFEARGH